jgi:FAD:protein FMN transferase
VTGIVVTGLHHNGKGFMRSVLRRKWFILAAFPLIAVSWLLLGGFGKEPEKIVSTEFSMNTSITITVYDVSREKAEKSIRKAFDEIARIEHVMEPLKGNGELERINAGPSGTWWDLNPDIRALLERSKYFYDCSGGAFDPTVGPVKWLWDFENGGRVPAPGEIERALPLVDLRKVEIRENRLRFAQPGMKLDFGAIAKGYAVDRMAEVLKRNGIASALVNAGGNIITIGKKPGNKAWVIGVKHPRVEKNITVEPEPNIAVATSGDYERFFIKDGVRYHHILDPKTGRPSHPCISATVWTDTAVDADALSTTIFVLGPEKGVALAKKLGNVETLIFYEKDGRIETAMSPGVVGRVKW